MKENYQKTVVKKFDFTVELRPLNASSKRYFSLIMEADSWVAAFRHGLKILESRHYPEKDILSIGLLPFDAVEVGSVSIYL